MENLCKLFYSNPNAHLQLIIIMVMLVVLACVSVERLRYKLSPTEETNEHISLFFLFLSVNMQKSLKINIVAIKK